MSSKEVYLIKTETDFVPFELPEPGKPVMVPELSLEIYCLEVAAPSNSTKPPKPEKPEKPEKETKVGKGPRSDVTPTGKRRGRPPKNKPADDVVTPVPEPVPAPVPTPVETPTIPESSAGTPLPGVAEDTETGESDPL